MQEWHIPTIEEALTAHIPDTKPSKNANRNAAVAMILADQPDHGLSALFIQRAEHPEDPWSGQMAMPGGRYEPFDKTLDQAAIRETLEEVGVDLSDAAQLGRLSDIYGGRLTTHRLAVSPFVFHMDHLPEVTPNYEVADTVWVPLSFMGSPENVSPYIFHRDPSGREFPSFNYEGYPIWGLTYRILSSFYELFGISHPGEVEVTDVE
jgi:8-oxo-dGTP pyrophosphatase MutT (NUDIX family)